MEPIHLIEYELTSELATEVRNTLVRWESRRGWRRDLPYYLGALAFAALVIWLGLTGWISTGVASGLLCLVALFVLIAVYRRWSGAHMASLFALLALGTSDRRVRIEFLEKRLRMETEYFRGEGAWTEFEEAVIFPTFWLLRFTNGGQVMLPAAKVSPQVEEFIRAQALEVDAPIRQVS